MTAAVAKPLGDATAAAIAEGFADGFSGSAALPPAAEVAAFQRIARDVQDEMMVALLGTLQHCASVCAEIALVKLNDLHGQMQKALEEERLSRQQRVCPTEAEEDHGGTGSVESFRMYEDLSEEESGDVDGSQEDYCQSSTLIDSSEVADDDVTSFDGLPYCQSERLVLESDTSTDTHHGDVSASASTATSIAPFAGEELHERNYEASGEISINEDEWSRLMKLCSEELTTPEFQKPMQHHRRHSTPSSWGEWLSFLANGEDIYRVEELRRSGRMDKHWLSVAKELRFSTCAKLLGQMKDAYFGNDVIKHIYQSGLRSFCASSNMLAALAFQDLLIVQGPLRAIPLESLEVAWALRLYPLQVTALAAGSEDFSSLAALRRRINDVIETSNKDISPPCPGRAHGALTAPSGGMTDLTQRSEECLIGIGYRVIELLNLQEIVNACASRLFPKDSRGRIEFHKALIVAGACGADALYDMLRLVPPNMPMNSKLPKGMAKCQLNASLQSMGLTCLLTEEQNLTLRSKAREYKSKSCLVQNGLAPVLITAPHNIVLVRDGKPPHRMEESTTLIADRMAARLQGYCLTWSRREQFRTELHWAMAKRREVCQLTGNAAGVLDATNRDPNCLEELEVEDNEWFKQMKQAHDRMSSGRLATNKLLHLDIHGCRGPPHNAAHLSIGLGALRQQQLLDGMHDTKSITDFGRALQDGVEQVIAGLNLEPRCAAVCVVVPDDMENPPAMSGIWKTSSKRKTQTQQAMMAGFAHCCQLEMSMALRRALSSNKDALRQFTDGLWGAYNRFVSFEGYRYS
mmetsp:Transcript_77352/g.145910  ORF Transcript_77352/g.145910 Transcript_77352/m.145910 type:complete len:804 (-) Transcript_77352:29-2440(-)